jgi:hypothetical protein
MSHESHEQQQRAPRAAAVSSPGSSSAEADTLFTSIALFVAVAQGGVQRPELYAPTLNRLSKRAAEQLFCPDARAQLVPLPPSAAPSAPLVADHMAAVRPTCYLSGSHGGFRAPHSSKPKRVRCAQVARQRPALAIAMAGTRGEKARASTLTQLQSQSTGTSQLQLFHVCRFRCRRVYSKANIAPRRMESSKPKPSAQLMEELSLSGEMKQRERPKETPELNCSPPKGKQPFSPRRSQNSTSDENANFDYQKVSKARLPSSHDRNSDDNSKPEVRAERKAEVKDSLIGTSTTVWVLRLLPLLYHIHGPILVLCINKGLGQTNKINLTNDKLTNFYNKCSIQQISIQQ